MEPVTYRRVMSGLRPSDDERQQGVDAIRSAASYVLPTSAAEAGAMALFGPFGKVAKLGGLGAMLGGYGTEADAAPPEYLIQQLLQEYLYEQNRRPPSLY